MVVCELSLGVFFWSPHRSEIFTILLSSIISTSQSDPSAPSPSSWPLPLLEPAQIRLVVYQDCERRGRNVLFDSSVKKKTPEDTPIAVSHVNVFCHWLDLYYTPKCCREQESGPSLAAWTGSESCQVTQREKKNNEICLCY